MQVTLAEKIPENPGLTWNVKWPLPERNPIVPAADFKLRARWQSAAPAIRFGMLLQALKTPGGWTLRGGYTRRIPARSAIKSRVRNACFNAVTQAIAAYHPAVT